MHLGIGAMLLVCRRNRLLVHFFFFALLVPAVPLATISNQAAPCRVISIPMNVMIGYRNEVLNTDFNFNTVGD
jgi:hypothetical protein